MGKITCIKSKYRKFIKKLVVNVNASAGNKILYVKNKDPAKAPKKITNKKCSLLDLSFCK
mgnify:CR=1 FL=1